MKIRSSIHLPWGHVRSHKIFWRAQFSRFDVYGVQTQNRLHDKQSIYRCMNEERRRRQFHRFLVLTVDLWNTRFLEIKHYLFGDFYINKSCVRFTYFFQVLFSIKCRLFLGRLLFHTPSLYVFTECIFPILLGPACYTQFCVGRLGRFLFLEIFPSSLRPFLP